MSRYIDADALLEHLEKDPLFPLVERHGISDVIKSFPTADVVEVIRCKDCRWWKSIYSWNGKEHKVCVREPYEPPREADDFCSYGERREDGETL